MNKLIWEGLTVDLGDQTKIGITYQVADIGDISSRRQNFSNIFKLPLTSNNKKIFGNSDNVNSLSDIPYKIGFVTYIEDGVLIIDNGIGVVESIDNNINVRVNSGNASFFQSFQGLTVGQLFEKECWARGEFIWWYRNEILEARDGSKEYIFPLANMTENQALVEMDNIEMQRMLPWLFVKSIFKRAAQIRGYNLQGDFIESDVYSNLILSPDNVSYDQDIINGVSSPKKDGIALPFYEFVGGGFNNNLNPAFTGNVPATGIGGGTFTYYFDFDSDPFFLARFVPTGVCEPNLDYVDTIGFKGLMTFSYSIGLQISRTNTSFSPNIQYGLLLSIYEVGNPTPILENWLLDEDNDDYIGSSFEYTDTLTVTGTFLPYKQYFCRITLKLQEAQLTGFDYTIYKVGAFTLEPQFFYSSCEFANEQTYGGIIFWNQFFKLPATSLIKDVLNLYAVIPDVNDVTKVAKFSFNKSLLENKKNAKDWSAKVDTRLKDLSFKLNTNYAQKNNLKYKENDFVTLGYGDGFFSINDLSLEAEKDLIQLSVSATESYEEELLLVPRVKIYQNDWTPNSCGSRVLLLSIEDTLTGYNFIDDVEAAFSTNENIPFCYFNNPLYDESLMFDYLIPKYFATLVVALDKTKKIKLYLLLKPTDVQQLDFMTPIYLNVQSNNVQAEGYFYINKVENYKQGVTRCELVKV